MRYQTAAAAAAAACLLGSNTLNNITVFWQEETIT
jgi:hypothetical protein